MSELLIGYARVSTDAQDLTAQRDALDRLGVPSVVSALPGEGRDAPGGEPRCGQVEATALVFSLVVGSQVAVVEKPLQLRSDRTWRSTDRVCRGVAGQHTRKRLVGLKILDVAQNRDRQRDEPALLQERDGRITRQFGALRADEHEIVGVDVVAEHHLREVGILGRGEPHRGLGL